MWVFVSSVAKTICRKLVRCPKLAMKINEDEIKYEREACFLSLLFDRQLTRKRRTEDLVARCVRLTLSGVRRN